jgi:hypothetical protein
VFCKLLYSIQLFAVTLQIVSKSFEVVITGGHTTLVTSPDVATIVEVLSIPLKE